MQKLLRNSELQVGDSLSSWRKKIMCMDNVYRFHVWIYLALNLASFEAGREGARKEDYAF